MSLLHGCEKRSISLSVLVGLQLNMVLQWVIIRHSSLAVFRLEYIPYLTTSNVRTLVGNILASYQPKILNAVSYTHLTLPTILRV